MYLWIICAKPLPNQSKWSLITSHKITICMHKEMIECYQVWISHWGLNNIAGFCEQHSHMHSIGWTFKKVSICSGDYIIWTSDNPVQWRIYASSGPDASYFEILKIIKSQSDYYTDKVHIYGQHYIASTTRISLLLCAFCALVSVTDSNWQQVIVDCI